MALGAPVATDASTTTRLTNSFVPVNAVPVQGYRDRRTSGLGADLTWNLGAATLYYLGSRRLSTTIS